MHWVIGDVQGCLRELEELCDHPDFASGVRLTFLGDLVNRGPHSAEVLRWFFAHTSSVQSILGNHEIHFLRIALGVVPAQSQDEWIQALSSQERKAWVEAILAWPLLIEENHWLLVHGGHPPTWSENELRKRCQSASAALQRNPESVLATGAKNKTEFQETIHWVTRLRFVEEDGTPTFAPKGPPGSAPAPIVPWFTHPLHTRPGAEIAFGHWAALGVHHEKRFWGLDGGCVWGGELAALELNSKRVRRIPSHQPQNSHSK